MQSCTSTLPSQSSSSSWMLVTLRWTRLYGGDACLPVDSFGEHISYTSSTAPLAYHIIHDCCNGQSNQGPGGMQKRGSCPPAKSTMPPNHFYRVIYTTYYRRQLVDPFTGTSRRFHLCSAVRNLMANILLRCFTENDERLNLAVKITPKYAISKIKTFFGRGIHASWIA